MLLAFTTGVQPGRLALMALAIVFACFVVINGVLLIVRPDLFLRLRDWLNPGDYWGKTAEWRRDVGNLDYKLLGIGFVVVGMFFVVVSAKALFKALLTK